MQKQIFFKRLKSIKPKRLFSVLWYGETYISVSASLLFKWPVSHKQVIADAANFSFVKGAGMPSRKNIFGAINHEMR
jgi:hypothetical protein